MGRGWFERVRSARNVSCGDVEQDDGRRHRELLSDLENIYECLRVLCRDGASE